MTMRAENILGLLTGGLIVSCQAYPGEPMRDPSTMAQIARAAVLGGAVAVRLQGIADIRAAADLTVPIVGLVKDGGSGVFITPTLEHARAVADAGRASSRSTAHVDPALTGSRWPKPSLGCGQRTRTSS